MESLMKAQFYTIFTELHKGTFLEFSFDLFFLLFQTASNKKRPRPKEQYEHISMAVSGLPVLGMPFFLSYHTGYRTGILAHILLKYKLSAYMLLK
jgi:hypothetical protein